MEQLWVRTPEQGDGPAMARVHVQAWQAAYRGLVPALYLDGLDEERGARAWEDRLAGEPVPAVDPYHHELLVVEADADSAGTTTGGPDSEIVGIATVGPDRDAPESDTGEVWMINVRPDAWGSGAGSRLLDAAQRKLSDLGYRSAVLWVIAGNVRARRFYERHGWRPDGVEKREVIGGRLVRELRYSLGELAAAPA